MFSRFAPPFLGASLPGRRHLALLALVSAAAIGLSGCAKKHPEVTGSIQMEPDYRERHPILLTDAPRTLEIYAARGPNGLDFRQDEDIRSFAAEYKSSGKGAVIAAVPRGTSSLSTSESLAGIRRSLNAAGVPARYMQITSYNPVDGSSAAPIRLSFLKLQAKVDSFCGQWPTDISGASTSERFKNQSPSNFGCSYQSAIAAQVAYPIDLVRPRQEGPIDVEKRSQAIKSLRSGKDPSTQWGTSANSVSGAQ